MPGKVGSGLTLVVGENNSGKTSLLEAMRKDGLKVPGNPNASVDEADAESGSLKLVFWGEIDGEERAIRTVDLQEWSTWELRETWGQGVNGCPTPVFIPARRHWSPMIQNGTLDAISASTNLRSAGPLRQPPEGSVIESAVAEYFRAVESDRSLKQECLAYLRRVFPTFEDFSTGSIDNRRYVKYRMEKAGGTYSHRADFLGDGVISVMRIIISLIAQRGETAVVIDEPELSLHPLAQKHLARILAEISEGKQIIISTHSPYFIEFEYVKNGAKVNRLSRKPGDFARIFTLGGWSQYKGLFSDDWRRPYGVDAVAKELFFQDDILFVEGVEDMSLLRHEGTLSEAVNVFGYGVGGYNNLLFALRLAHDLGLSRVAVLCDGDVERNSPGLIEKLTNIDPRYLVVELGRDDIRDKPACCYETGKKEPRKDGYFDERGHLKPNPKTRHEYFSIINGINNYFGIPSRVATDSVATSSPIYDGGV